MNGVVIQWRAITSNVPRMIRDGKWVTQPEWMDGATVGVISASNEAIFTREVKVDRFEFAK